MSAHPITRNAIRQALRNSPDGLTRREIQEITGLKDYTVLQTTRKMNDLYVDRWVMNTRGSGWAPVFCLRDTTEVVQDAPMPDISVAEYRMRMEMSHA
jgi:hypothetical protein